MARRPDPTQFDKPLSQAEVKEMQRRMALLSPHHVLETYRRAHQQCGVTGDLLPRAAAIQEMVIAWKVLRKWRQQGPPARD